MKATKLLIIIFISLFAVLFWVELPAIYLTPHSISQFQGKVNSFLVEDVRQQKQSVAPLPLRVEGKESLNSSLTKEGVIRWTNIQREKYGLPLLKENTKLDVSSQIKVNDMFTNQYFAHESPQGLRVGDLTKEEGYQFIEVGENLALGNFKNDEDLVNAWMNSPGHKANILNPKYQNIGVAVKRGVFEGRTTWLAVQHFGFPLSACPLPDTTLKKQIETLQTELSDLTLKLNNTRNAIQNTKFKYGPVYLRKIDYYNNLVSQYNNLVEEIGVLVSKYNNQVKSFNTCAQVNPS